MKTIQCIPVLGVMCLVFLAGCVQQDVSFTEAADDLRVDFRNTVVQQAGLFTFMQAGPLGGSANVLEEGTTYPPTRSAKATLKRSSTYIQVNLHTGGLPHGAYTMWIVIFNDPLTCNEPNPAGGLCAGAEGADLLLPKTAVIWGDGKVVQSKGVGNFSTRLEVGENREPGTQEALLGEDLPGYALTNPLGAEVHLIVKYHGPVSSDPDVLEAQLSSLLGSCGEDEGANSFYAGELFGVQCFDPQAAVFPAP